MKTITLLETTVYKEGYTTKYWREIECKPQCVELKKWGNNSPLFILNGVIINSHDAREIGKEKECYIQTYTHRLDDKYKIEGEIN